MARPPLRAAAAPSLPPHSPSVLNISLPPCPPADDFRRGGGGGGVGGMDDYDAATSSHFGDLGPRGGGDGGAAVALPEPELASLPALAKALGEVSLFQRDRAAGQLLRPGYLRRLLDLFRVGAGGEGQGRGRGAGWWAGGLAGWLAGGDPDVGRCCWEGSAAGWGLRRACRTNWLGLKTPFQSFRPSCQPPTSILNLP